MFKMSAIPEAIDLCDPKLHDDVARIEKSTPTNEGAESKSVATDGQHLKDLSEPDAARRFRHLGMHDADFVTGFFKQMVMVSSDGEHCNETNSNFDLAFVRGTKPRQQVEAALAMQMSIVHRYTIQFARRISTAGSLQEFEILERIFTKLCRTYLSQMQTLKIYRSSDDPGMIVQNVSVRDGGQAAIVGKVTRGD